MLLMINSSDVKLGFIESLILKQTLISHLLLSRNNYLEQTSKSVIKANLITLFCCLPFIIKLKKKQLSYERFGHCLEASNDSAFKLAFKLKIKDQECIKLLSQVTNRNKYGRLNQLVQTLCLMSFNVNLLLHIHPNKKLDLASAISFQFSKTPKWLLPLPYLTPQANRLQHLVLEELIAGCILFTSDKRYLVAISQTPELDGWYCFQYQANQKTCTGQIEKILSHKIYKVFPLQAIDWTLLFELIDDEEDFFPNYSISTLVASNEHSSLSLAVPEYWPETINSLVTGDLKQLSQVLDSNFAFKQIVLNYASNNNRINTEIKDSRHAIALLGMDRVFPVITIGMFKIVQESYKTHGSEEINNKINFITNLTLETGKTLCKNTLPEYAALLHKILITSLFSIPKVRFSAASPAIASGKKSLTSARYSIAELFQYRNIKLWLQITNKALDKWRLPSFIRTFTSKYIKSLVPGQNVTFTTIEHEWVNTIDLAVCEYLICLNSQLTKEQTSKLANICAKSNLSIAELKLTTLENMSKAKFYTDLS